MKIGSFFKKTKYVSLNSVMAKEAHHAPAAAPEAAKAPGAPEAKRRLSSRERISSIIDDGTFIEMFEDVVSGNPLDFQGYDEKKEDAARKSGNKEAVITGVGTIDGIKVAVGAMDPYYMMGSMGFGVGEKVTLIAEEATKQNIPLIIFTASGGARMQEGIVSLMQMAKTSAAIRRHSDSGNLYISILTDPTTGGVTASFAMQGDINVSEPGALIGFAGPRVIEQTIRQKLPEGFQTAEFLEEHGMIDVIIEPSLMKKEISNIVSMHAGDSSSALQSFRSIDEIALDADPGEGSGEESSTAWDKVKKAREKGRLSSLEIINGLFQDFVELRGDRQYADDKAIVGGVARFNGLPVTVIGHQKGRDLEENLKRNFGMAHPEGYRKAQRLMDQAQKFNRPIICLIDTAGAFCGLGAEERGQGEAIARSLYHMAGLEVPVISIVIGEGGSGGALALGVADRVYMLSNSVYSILSPEGFASILWKDASRAGEAAEKMKITAGDILSLGIIDGIIPECETSEKTLGNIGAFIESSIKELSSLEKGMLVDGRYEKFRKMGK